MSRVTVIAEIGINFDGSMPKAKYMIKEAKNYCGADIAKFQLYDVDTIFPNQECLGDDGRNWYEEVKRTQLTQDQAFELAVYCQEIGIEFMVSAFDTERLDWLALLGVKRYKIASRSNSDLNLLNWILKHPKPTLVSCNQKDVNRPGPRDWYNNGARLLYCLTEGPAYIESFNFRDIDFVNTYSGISDHCNSIIPSLVAVARGATFVERHFTLNTTSEEGPDHIFSSEPEEFKKMVSTIREMEKCLD